MRSEYNRFANEELLFKDIPKQLSFLSAKEKHFDSVLTKMNMGNTSLENNLLRTINFEADKNKLKVIDFNSPHIYVYNGNQLNTFSFTLEGSFSNLLRAIYFIEQKGSFGEIIHIDFEKKKNYRTNKNYLNATVLLQSFK